MRSSGTKLMPMRLFTASFGDPQGHPVPADQDVAGADPHHAEEREEEVALAHAVEPADAQNLAGPEGEGKILHASLDGESFGGQDRRLPAPGRLCRLGREGRGQRASDHQLDHPVVGDFVGPEAPHHAAVAQDRQAVAEIPHLLHPVRDEDDRRALGAQPGEERAEPLHVVAGERRGRLVQQEQSRLARDGTSDLDLLPGRQRQRSHLGVGVDIVEAESCEGAPHLPLRLAPPDVSGGPDRLIGQQHALHDGEIADQRNLLMGSLDSEPV